MVATRTLETDYLVVGAGAIGMSFVDTLVDHCDADVVMIDRRQGAGGHWLDTYPFVQLHQPSLNYGVNSTPLGKSRLEPSGRDRGFNERAGGAEIAGYFDDVMRHRLLTSGQVRFFPMSDHLGGGRFRSRITGQETQVVAREKVVDATYMASRVPATEPPPFAVGDGVRCVPVGDLTRVDTPPSGYVIVGGGKTALDAITWLLDQGTDPARITWVRPQDAWMLNRKYFQPGAGVLDTFEGIVVQLEAIASSSSVDEFFDKAEHAGVVLRTDPAIRPTTMKGATVSVSELNQIRRVERIVRLGHVVRIDRDEIALDEGSIPTDPGCLHVHCAARGLGSNPPKVIFGDHDITLQVISRVNLPLSAGLTGVVEASDRTTEEKNALCPPNPWPMTPFGWVRSLIQGMQAETAWLGAADIQAWVDGSRLNLLGGLRESGDSDTVTALLGRFVEALFPAFERFDEFKTQATPAESTLLWPPVAAA
ncbi:MAG: NAD(P)-binding protein [Acidimicrobiia bacterium]|nr:NAD(P)-binding protein [Acidimicrobiia bacterium]